jgi:predicted PurR-regulated permease PerM
MPTRALTWAIFTAAAVIVAGLCMAILHPFAHVIAWAAELGGLAVTAWIEQHVSDVVHGVGEYTITIANGLFDAVLSSVLVIFAMFLLLRDGKGFVEAIPDFLPFERGRSEALLGRIKNVVLASVYGVVTIALLQGVLCGSELRCSLRCSAD